MRSKRGWLGLVLGLLGLASLCKGQDVCEAPQWQVTNVVWVSSWDFDWETGITTYETKTNTVMWWYFNTNCPTVDWFFSYARLSDRPIVWRFPDELSTFDTDTARPFRVIALPPADDYIFRAEPRYKATSLVASGKALSKRSRHTLHRRKRR